MDSDVHDEQRYVAAKLDRELKRFNQIARGFATSSRDAVTL